MLALLLMVLTAAPADAKEAGTAAYRKGNLAKACALFAQVVKETPGDASGWSDLGLCLARQGKKAEALVAMDRAISLGDETTRKAAYYNLGKFELRRSPIAELLTAEEKTVDWPKPSGCEEQWSLRADSYGGCGTSYCNEGSGLWFGPRTRVDSLRSPEEGGDGYDLTVLFSRQELCPHDCWRYGSCDPCGPMALDANREPWLELEKGPLSALAPRVKACVGKQEQGCLKDPTGADCGNVWLNCVADTCTEFQKRADKALSPAEAALKKTVAGCMKDCVSGCEAGNTRVESFSGCSVVSVNPCAKAVGLVCPTESGGLRAEEVGSK